MGHLFKFWSSTRLEKWLLCEAGVLLLLSSLSLKIIPFMYIYSFLCKRYLKTHACEASNCAGDSKLIELSILRAANRLPWNNLCLSRSIAAFIMFRRRGIPAVLLAGIKVIEDSSLDAHAWVDTDLEANGKSSDNSGFATMIRIGTRDIDR